MKRSRSRSPSQFLPTYTCVCGRKFKREPWLREHEAVCAKARLERGELPPK